jgi:hypothetical protein
MGQLVRIGVDVDRKGKIPKEIRASHQVQTPLSSFIGETVMETQARCVGLRRCSRVAAVLLGCGLSSVAVASDWKVTGEFGWLGVGKAQQLEKGHLFWVGEFSGTFFNDKGDGSPFHFAGVRCPASNDVDLNHKKNRAAGTCVISEPGGNDQAYLTWQCEGDTEVCHGTFDYTGGTGKYQGVSGSNKFTGVIHVNWPDGMVSGYALWNR